MDLKFRVAARIAKPLHEVFEAVADPATLSHYFTTGGANARMVTGAPVAWDFHAILRAFPVYVIEVVPDQKLLLLRTEQQRVGKDCVITLRVGLKPEYYKIL